MVRRFSLCVVVAVLAAACSLGPKQLEDGHLAYNEAVRTASDKELLLNIVRARYLDSIEFLSTNSISAQLEFSVGVGAKAGTELGEASHLMSAEAGWSNRPTFTFTPQRGVEFAHMMMTPVSTPVHNATPTYTHTSCERFSNIDQKKALDILRKDAKWKGSCG